MMSVKADLAICSSVIGVLGYCKSVAFASTQKNSILALLYLFNAAIVHALHYGLYNSERLLI